MMSTRPSFVPGRRYRVALNVAVAVLSLLVILATVNHLASVHLRWRRDLSTFQDFELSPLTRQVLAGITNEVKVTVLFPRDSDLYGHIDTMLREYSGLQPRLKVRKVDYVSDPATALLVRAGYKLGQEEVNLVLFDNGSQYVRVAEAELSAYDTNLNDLMSGKQREIRRSGFKGEMLFTSALANLAMTNRVSAAFVIGHDEHRPDSEDQLYGQSNLAKLLASKSVTVSTLRLDGTNAIPPECQLLLITGPTQPFLPAEVERLGRFLAGGGRVLLTLNASAPGWTPLDDLLNTWGMIAPPIYAADADHTLGGFSLVATNFASHPVTLPLARKDSRLLFQRPRVVGTLSAGMLPADAPKAQVLVTTGPGGVTKSDLRGGIPAFRPGLDKTGEIPLAAAAEKGGVAGVAVGRGNGRLVVVGDSMVFGNAAFNNQGNVDFAELTFAWLLDRTQLLAIGPKPIREYRLYLTPRQGRTVKWTLLGFLPGSVVALGFVVWSRRRS